MEDIENRTPRALRSVKKIALKERRPLEVLSPNISLAKKGIKVCKLVSTPKNVRITVANNTLVEEKKDESCMVPIEESCIVLPKEQNIQQKEFPPSFARPVPSPLPKKDSLQESKQETADSVPLDYRFCTEEDPPCNYWQVLAEQRRQALQSSLNENNMLHNENSALKSRVLELESQLVHYQLLYSVTK